jgi:hypothetical protein
MNEQIFDDLDLEKVIKAQFGVAMEVDSVIARRFAISRSGYATLFLTSKKQLYLYIDSQSRTLLSDVKKIVSRVGLRADLYLPPKGRPHYFDEVGQQKFREVFPGRGNVSEIDVAYYRTLAPYNPALILIGEVKDGHIYCFDSDASGSWRPVTSFSYRRIRTS